MTTQDDLFTMANLSPLLTGLPFVVWIPVRNEPRDIDPSSGVKISRGLMAIPEDLRTAGLSADELRRFREWSKLNWEVLYEYWERLIFTDEAISRLRRVGK